MILKTGQAANKLWLPAFFVCWLPARLHRNQDETRRPMLPNYLHQLVAAINTLELLAWLGPIGMILGLIGLVMGAYAFLRYRNLDRSAFESSLEQALSGMDTTLNRTQTATDSLSQAVRDLTAEQREYHTELLAASQERFSLAAQVEQLYAENEQLRQRIDVLAGGTHDGLPVRPLLVICGDAEFCQSDLAEFDKIHDLWYTPLAAATKAMLDDEIQRRRQQGNLYPWAHVSAHGGPQGILLADGWAERSWWNVRFRGFEVMFLANCDGPGVGDMLFGIVEHVVVLYGSQESSYISQFAYWFWTDMLKNQNALSAYELACRNVPLLKNYSDMR